MGLVEFLKSVGGVAVPDEVIQQARQNDEDEKKSRQQSQEAEANSNDKNKAQ